MKKRLIGAVVLVILAVIFLPMVFDGTSSTTEQAVDLSIPPSPDREFETRVLPLTPQSPAAAIGGDPTMPATDASDPDAIVTVDANVTKPADAMAGTDMAPESAPIDTAAYQPGVSTTPAAAGSTASTAPTTSGTAATAAPTPNVSAPPAAPSVAAPPSDGRGRYVVSFGSYTRKANADALVAALRKGGVQAYAESVDVNGQPGQRVRAGPFVDRVAADETRLIAKRVRSDVTGTVVEIDEASTSEPTAASTARAAAATPATPSAAAAPKTPAAALTGWAVQIGAYKAEADAAAQRDKLRGAGFAAFVDPVRTGEGTLYRVRVGPEVVRANAEKLRDSLKQQFALSGMVVNHP